MHESGFRNPKIASAFQFFPYLLLRLFKLPVQQAVIVG